MTLDYFKQLLKGNNGIKISDDLIIFNDFELWNRRTDESKQYKSVDELVADNPDVRKIIETTDEFYLDWSGGRGSSSGSSKVAMGGGFGNAPGRKGKDSERLLPAELNLNVAGGNSVSSVLNRFQNKYGNADREYAISVDENGYVKQHIKGGKHSVGITGDKGDTLIHNHPSGSNFSKADMESFALTGIKSLVATSSNKNTKGTYTITKGNKFNSKAFVKAVNRAQWPSNLSYNDGVSWWLKKNQKTYGYKFTHSGVKGASKGEFGW